MCAEKHFHNVYFYFRFNDQYTNTKTDKLKIFWLKYLPMLYILNYIIKHRFSGNI